MIADLPTRRYDARSVAAMLHGIWVRYVAVHFISQAEEDAHLARLERSADDLLTKGRLAQRVANESGDGNASGNCH